MNNAEELIKQGLIIVGFFTVSFFVGMGIKSFTDYEAATPRVIENTSSTTKAVEMDIDRMNYDCQSLRRLDGNVLDFCIRRNYRNLEAGTRYVMGYYVRAEDAIYVDKDISNGGIIHELLHSVSAYKNGALSEEDKAYQLQDLYYQLIDKGLLQCKK